MKKMAVVTKKKKKKMAGVMKRKKKMAVVTRLQTMNESFEVFSVGYYYITYFNTTPRHQEPNNGKK